MTGVQRFFGNDRNHVRDATVTASSTLPAADTAIAGTPDRQGYGTVGLSGSYTGADDAEFEIEILAGSGDGVPSQPVYSGAGNGTLSDLSATGLDAQTITIELVSLGISTATARLPLGTTALVAKTAGTGGNGIELEITPDLTIGATVGAFPVAAAAGESSWTGPAWDWGQPALTIDGTVPTSAPRVVIGGDTATVYRLYKEWQTDRWSYRLTPALTRAVAAGAAVQAVTGDYAATVTQGVTVESYPDLVTQYDLLSALSASVLVAVSGVVVDDRLPGGMGAVDIPYRTIATALITGRDGSKTLLDATLTVSADADTGSQIVTVECTDNTAVGSERWAVVSDVSGSLGEAVSGRAFNSGVQFTIPQVIPDADPLGVAITSVNYADRPDGGREPAVCLRHGTQGAKAESETLTFVYTAPKPAGCDCDYAQVSGRIDPDLLGLEDFDLSVWDAEYSTRLTALVDYMSTFVEDQVAILSPDTPTTTLWSPASNYSSATLVVPPVDNGHYYRVQVPSVNYSYTLAGGPTIYTNTLNPQLAEMPAWPINGDTFYSKIDPSAALNSIIAGFSGTLVDFSPSVVWAKIEDMGLLKPQMTGATTDIEAAYTLTRLLASCLADVWSVEAARDMWDDLWTELQSDLTDAAASGAVSDVLFDPVFSRKYEAKIDAIRVRAGLLPKKFEATSSGSAVWRDRPDQWRWVCNGGEYLPFYTNEICYVAKMIDGEPVSMQTAAFAIACACEELLVEGDTVTVSILSRPKTYAVGDLITIAVTGGQSLVTSGGVTGDDTLTWRVTGSVDSFDNYALTPDELPYSDGGLEMQINRGAIPFVLGDRWMFELETAGLFKWRKNSGTWSSNTAIADTVSLSDGLSATFTRGVAPSFVAGDSFPFSVIQPFAPGHVSAPRPFDDEWRWSGASPSIYFDFGSAKAVSAVGILLHSLPAGATITLGAGSTSGATDWTLAVTRRNGPIVVMFDAQTYRYWRLTFGSATGGAVGWVWLGEPLTTAYSASECSLSRAYSVQRGAGINPTSRYGGRGVAGAVTWANGHLTQSDLDGLLAMLDAAKSADDEPVCFLPNYGFPAESALVTLPDEYEITDRWALQPDDTSRRWLALSMQFAPVIM